jgi:Na+/H+ antiporter NhaD/arsenite permease-like protein
VNDWQMGLASGMISIVLNNFTTAASFMNLHAETHMNDAYTLIVAYTTAVSGNILSIGSVAGSALIKAEHMHIGWYFRYVGLKTAVGALLGFLVLLLIVY